MGGRGSAGGGKSSGNYSFATHNGFTYVTHKDKDGYGRVGVLKPGGGEIGAITWMPGPGGKGRVVGDVTVSEAYRRQGIASQLWKQAQKATGGTVAHHPNRTEAGEAFARKVGGITPSRSNWRG